jgi:hypothetical protein
VAPGTKLFVDISDPVPPIALAGAGGVVVLAGLAFALWSGRKVNGKPQPTPPLRFHGEMTGAEPSLSTTADGLGKKPVVSFAGSLEWGAFELIRPRNDLIEWEKRYDG